MTDKEFKRLSRAQLLDIIYQFQLQVEKLTEQNVELKRELADKRLRLSKVGNIAEAALEINDYFRSAQKAADHYLSEVKTIREETEKERQRILAEAKSEAERIVMGAVKSPGGYDSAVETILNEFKQSRSDNG